MRAALSSEAAAAFLIFAACGLTGDITVAIPPHAPSPTASALSGVRPTRIAVREVSERPGATPGGRIGERKTIGIPGTMFGNVPMGAVTVTPAVGPLFTDMLRAELRAAGHEPTDRDASVTLAGDIRRFALYTGATLLYWDVVVEAALEVTATAPAGNATRIFTAVATERTYVSPGEQIVARVVRAAVDDLARKFREDRQIAAALSAQ